MSEYHKLPIAQKRAIAIDRAREPAVTCPDCDTQVMPTDLIAHVKTRCAGPRDPGPGAKWLTHREVVALGVPKQTLKDWVDTKKVRYRGDRGDRVYLLRDLAQQVTRPHGNRRR